MKNVKFDEGRHNRFLKIKYRPKINQDGELLKVYKTYKFLFFKFTISLPPIWGENNKIYLIENGIKKEVLQSEIGKLNINLIVNGNNNTIILPNLIYLKNCVIRINGDNNYVEIKEINYRDIFAVCNLLIDLYSFANNRKIIIGKDFSSVETKLHCKGDNKEIIIGDDCMFSWDIRFENSDSHGIFDIKTKKLLNDIGNIYIGNHVWIGSGVHVLKNAKISDGCIVGTESLVNKRFDEKNCVIAGTPQKYAKKIYNGAEILN